MESAKSENCIMHGTKLTEISPILIALAEESIRLAVWHSRDGFRPIIEKIFLLREKVQIFINILQNLRIDLFRNLENQQN
jgi:hypothetical protein